MTKQNSDYLISVIGATGAGKTTFISKATGRTDLVVGHGINSCTKDVLPVPFQHNGKNITLIDTPGFDDSQVSDADILERIAEFLSTKYQQGQLLNALIFLHPITGNRAPGSERKRTRLFKKLLGKDAYKRVIIATTMWGMFTDDSHGMRQQEERQDDPELWGDMTMAGATIFRHDNTAESALELVEKAMTFPPTPLQIQVELKENGGKLIYTEAARQLDDDLGDKVSVLRQEMDKVRRQRDVSDAERMAEVAELKDKISRMQAQQYSVRGFCVSKVQKCTKFVSDKAKEFGENFEKNLVHS